MNATSRSRRLGRPAGLCLLVLAWAGVGATAGPSRFSGTPWKERPEKFTLATGLPCIYHKDQSSPTTVIELVAAGGRSAVPKGLDGLAYLATRLTLEIPDEDKVRELMSQATRMSFLCMEDNSVILIECLSENL